MIWKGCVVLSLAICVLCDRRPAFSEVQVKKHHKELSHDDHQKSENHEEYANAHPSYEFSYKVDDPHTHDKKEQQETRDGDKVSGHYWLIQPDGHKRLVKYHVDGKRGFSADINYALNKHEVHYNTIKNDDHEKKEDEHKEEHIDEQPKEEHHIIEVEEIKDMHEKIGELDHKDVEHNKHEEEHEKHDQGHKEHDEEYKEHDDGHGEEHKEHDEGDKQHDEGHKEHVEGHKKHDEGDKKHDEAHKEHNEEEKFGEKIHEPEAKHKVHENHNASHKEHGKKDDKEYHEEHQPKPKEHHDLWSSIRNWDEIHKDEHEDVWSWPKLIHWDIKHDKDVHENHDDTHHGAPKVHEENDKKHGNSWSWRKSYDIWEVQHYGNEHEHDGKHHDVKEHKEEHEKPKEKLFIPASEESDKKKESSFGLRDHEHRGQPSYHMPIMNAKPIPYRRRRTRIYKSSA